MKKNRGTSLSPWFEEEMSMAVNRNRNVEQNIGLRPLFRLVATQWVRKIDHRPVACVNEDHSLMIPCRIHRFVMSIIETVDIKKQTRPSQRS